MSYVWRLFFPVWLDLVAVALAHCLTLCHHSKRRTLIGQGNCRVQSREKHSWLKKKIRKVQGIAPRTAWLRPATWFSRQHIRFLFILRADSVSLAGYWNLPRSSRTSAVSQAEPELEFVFDFIKNGFKYFSKRNFFPPCNLFLYILILISFAWAFFICFAAFTVFWVLGVALEMLMNIMIFN